MPETAITPQKISHVGTAPTLAAPDFTNGNKFANDGRTFLVVKNTDSNAKTVTINSRVKCNQNVDHDVVVVVPITTGEKWIGPFVKTEFDDSTGNVTMAWSGTGGATGVTCAAVQLPETGR